MGQKDILLKIVRLLTKEKISYLLTGSLAVAYYGFPRGTHDIDLVLEVKTKDFKRILRIVRALGRQYFSDKTQIREAIENFSQFNIYHLQSGIKIDFWVSNQNDFEKSKFLRRKKIFISRQKIFLISAEDLILTKLLWYGKLPSERHLADCKGIWKVQQKNLDKKYLNFWVEKFGLKDIFKEVKNGT